MSSLDAFWRARLGVAAVAGLIAGSTFAHASAVEASMLTGGPISPPIGHYEFCKSHADECSIQSSKTAPEHMTDELGRQLTNVNLFVNRHVLAMSDLDNYGRDEVWAYPHDGFGDCEDYVLEKRRRLIDGGMRVSALLITVVSKSDGEGHAVLTVRTDKGDFILDNLSDRVRLWTKTGYRFLKRQATNNTGYWVSILDGDEPLVSSVRY